MELSALNDRYSGLRRKFADLFAPATLPWKERIELCEAQVAVWKKEFRIDPWWKANSFPTRIQDLPAEVLIENFHLLSSLHQQRLRRQRRSARTAISSSSNATICFIEIGDGRSIELVDWCTRKLLISSEKLPEVGRTTLREKWEWGTLADQGLSVDWCQSRDELKQQLSGLLVMGGKRLPLTAEEMPVFLGSEACTATDRKLVIMCLGR
ncbi:hypothetical protein BV898_15838 [Hypsibius exemplaris]|uniref:Uncharacterized protein n=1 Tax=Hypsibius exemplaris TaxID=2072580 RepID=A0A9X6RKW1_HYPEX|nr:hypothetical protein BV898_15838 [Hypsibius exemplaris]